MGFIKESDHTHEGLYDASYFGSLWKLAPGCVTRRKVLRCESENGRKKRQLMLLEKGRKKGGKREEQMGEERERVAGHLQRTLRCTFLKHFKLGCVVTTRR